MDLYIRNILLILSGVIIGFVFSPPNIKRTVVHIESVKISPELTEALKESGCLALPLWDTESPGIQVCTYQESMARGWHYTRDEVDKRMKERNE